MSDEERKGLYEEEEDDSRDQILLDHVEGSLCLCSDTKKTTNLLHAAPHAAI